MIRRILVILGLAKPQWRVNFSKIPKPFIAKFDASKECTCGHKVLQGELAQSQAYRVGTVRATQVRGPVRETSSMPHRLVAR